MEKIRLVNMPFAGFLEPSIALTQIKSVIEARFNDIFSVDIAYLNLDFARYIGLELYEYISNSMPALYAGLGDWLFRNVAFPELPDNSQDYLQRFFWANNADVQRLRAFIAEKRGGLSSYLDELIAEYALDEASIVGFTSMFMQNGPSFAIAKRIKKRNPKVLTLIGGANCEYPMGGVIANRVKYLDFVFSGPALQSLPEFLQLYREGDLSRCKSIPGVFPQGDEGERDVGTLFGAELDINTPLALEYHGFLRKFERWFGKHDLRPNVQIQTSRGCWWGQRSHCTFCGLNGMSMPYHSIQSELAIEQFNKLFQYAGRISSIRAVDNILPKEYLSEVFPFLNTPTDIQIFYEVKADLTAEEFAVLSGARVNVVQPGIESLSTSTLKLMKKGTTAFQNVAFLKNCVTYEITPTWNLLVGFPKEKEEVYRQYIEIIPRLTHLPPPLGVFPIRFDRFSPYHTKAENYELDLHPMEFYSYVYPMSESELYDFAYYFTDQNFEAQYFVDMAQWIDRLQEVVEVWRKPWLGPEEKRPRLCLLDDSDIVCDSRAGEEVRYDVGREGKMLLEMLGKPMLTESLNKALTAKYNTDWNLILTRLEERGLIFREGERVLSLVVSDVAQEDAFIARSRNHNFTILAP